ncbi:hypothetical protein CERSUDRAFT_112203 [Gelatoporia subvermispora B]|uniref:SHSP domain-containing protein n=1 Tax=Ceriporiopsis subvermispora (strain B) TaxID=914234 RepID=M2PTF5_CERS8|nr:hypothetical protein CERSUDRAFT_112203 [Gelatoporia subvermispora B]
MSLTRQFFHELRPLFRMLDQPLGRSFPRGFPEARGLSLFDDPFFHSPGALRPAVDVAEEGNKYIVEAELPGVKKENIEVRVGDGGRSITIEGRVTRRSAPQQEQQQQVESPASGAGSSSAGDLNESADSQTQAVANAEEQNQISSERSFTGSSTFTRTVWLPRPVDAKNVSAKLDHGVLTLTVPKAQDSESVQINVE